MTPSPVSDKRTAAVNVVRRLRDAGFKAYWAGGCVRDMLMNRTPKDFDIATNALPAEVGALFPRIVEVGREFGVIQVIIDEMPFETATFRKDINYKDGRHPGAVHFCDEEEDARRRDFTINGMFFDPLNERLIDYVDGQADIERKRVRTIGDPKARYGEDYLRMLRAVRFASVLNFSIEEQSAEAIKSLAGKITLVSIERIQQELTRILTESSKPGRGIRMLFDLGLLQILLPEVARMAGQAQPVEYHPEGDVFEHTMLMLDAMSPPSLVLAYSALLHDVGKPLTARKTIREDGTERIRFDKHAETGAEAAEAILKRLRLPNRDIEDIVHCIRNHMKFMDVQNMRRATLRRLVGAPTFPVELELHRIDCASSHGDLDNYEFLKRFVEELKNEPVLPPPWINGRDIMALGIPEGPEIGQWHKKAYEAQLEGQFAGRDELLKWLQAQLPHVNRQT